MDNEMLSECIGELKTDIKWIKKALEDGNKKYAPQWVVYPVIGMTGVILTWVVTQWLNLIPTIGQKAETLISYLK